MSMELWQNDADAEVLWMKPDPVSLCPPQIAHGLTGFEAGASVVSSQWMIAWTIARPLVLYVEILVE